MQVFDSHSSIGGSVVPGAAANPAAVIADMHARGIDGAVLFSAHARLVDPLAGNRILRKMLDQGPNLYGCLVTNTNRVDASITVMREQMSSRKFVAMAVVSPRPDEPVHKLVADEIINSYRRYTRPLYLVTPNAEAVSAALEIARGYPMLKVVLVGMGGSDWRTAIAAAHQCTNVYLETSGAFDRAKLPAAVEALGTHRIVFGSGSPHVDPAAAMGLVEDSDLSEDARRKILFDNAQKLFGLDAPSEPEEAQGSTTS